MIDKQPILILGLPRSGTTWIGEVLSSAQNVKYLFEPDNEKFNPISWVCKKDLHRFPYLALEDESPDYHHFWDTVTHEMGSKWLANKALGLFLKSKVVNMEAYTGDKIGLFYIDRNMHRVGGGKQIAYRVEDHPLAAFASRSMLAVQSPAESARRIIIKSVHASLSGAWIAKRFAVKIIFVLRNPFSLYASYRRLKIPDGYRNLLSQETLQRDWGQYLPGPKRFPIIHAEENIVYQIMLMYKIIQSQLTAHPEWTLVSHDKLCLAPHEGYVRMFNDLGLTWSVNTNKKIESLNGSSGKGFTPKRIASQQPTQWKKEIASADQSMIQTWMDRFELRSFFQQYVNIE